MNGMNYDDWQAFLEQRDDRAGWQWPLNLAVAMHLAIFASAAVLQNMASSGPGFRFDNTVTVNFVSLSEPGPTPAAAPATELVPVLKEEASLPQPVEIKARKERKTAVKVAEPKKEVKLEQPVAKEVVQETELEKPVAKVVQPEQKPQLVEKATVKAEVKPEPIAEKVLPTKPIEKEVVAVKPEQAVKKTVEKAPEQKAAVVSAPKPETIPVVQVKKDVVSLNPVKQKKEALEKAKIAEAKKQEEAVKVAKLEAEKKAAALEEKRIAEEKAQKEQTAKIIEAKKERAKIAAQAKKQALAKAAKIEAEKKAAAAEARRKIAAMEQRKALAEARRIEHEAKQAQRAAVKAREQLVRALRQNVAVSSAIAGVGLGGAGKGTGAGSGSLLGNGGIGSGSGGVGSTVALRQYASSLNEKISSRWKVPEMVNADRKLKTVVALTVSKAGTIEDMKIEQKSGDALFDQSVLKALRSAEPLPNFPALIREPKLEFALNFTPQGLTL
ncbi:cell envelope integrity protein TolA [Candidatus Electronema sp. PJ]|uniref:cell envelope integrity protein TolA n=1 Tax=Candidatus Electronema sp. PJ TaxID=3401572 RepID=UPI003AA9991B